MNNILYIIIPYFNFLNSKQLEKNLNDFLEKNKFPDNVRLILSEGYVESQLKDYSNKFYKHLKFKFKNIFWIKENLINLAIDNLPEDWEFVVWMDRDVVFLSEAWVDESIEKLKKSDIIQPWKELEQTLESSRNPLVQTEGPKKSFLFRIKEEKNPILKRLGHPGMAWGINKNFYNKIKKIPDWFIIGGADRILACAFLDDNKTIPTGATCSITMAKKTSEYYQFFKNVKFDYVNCKIYHLCHGSRPNRKYLERIEILAENNFDPNNDIFYNEEKIIEFSKDWNDRASKQIKDYFISRQEDLIV